MFAVARAIPAVEAIIVAVLVAIAWVSSNYISSQKKSRKTPSSFTPSNHITYTDRQFYDQDAQEDTWQS